MPDMATRPAKNKPSAATRRTARAAVAPRDRYYRTLVRSYREIPSYSSAEWGNPGLVKLAISQLDQGKFQRAAQLADAMLRDDRVAGVLQTRVDSLVALPIRFKAQGDARRANAVAVEAAATWPEMAPECEVEDLLRWGLMMGIGVAQVPWSIGTGRWTPSLQSWHPAHLEYRSETDSLWVQPASGPALQVAPGDGQWVVYAPHGVRRGFMRGLVRSLALPWLVRQWAIRDWARYSEVHGQPTKVGIVPSATEQDKKDQFISDLIDLGSEGVVGVEQDEKGFGYGYKLVEAASQSWEGFLRLMERCDENIAVAILGANLGVSIKAGGSYAAASVHADVGAGRTLGDAKKLARAVGPQLLRPWAAYNFGDDGLAPSMRYVTSSLEDKKLTADTLDALGDGLQKLRGAGMNVDVVKMARRFKIPVLPGDPPPVPKKPGETPPP